MGTPYAKIYERFLNCITDFNFVNIDDLTLNDMFRGWLHSAAVKVRTTTDLSKYDDDIEVFENDLSDLDIELLAMGMTLAWLDQALNSTELTLMMIGGKEEKYYSQAGHIAELRKLREDTKLEMKRLHSYHTYTNNSYFNS